ncbi:hypothetical protein V6N13_108878 [Hibiscus sabdariffa]
MAATPPPSAHLGGDVPGWRWDEKREFRVGYAYAVSMKVCWERNGVADKLVSLGRKCTQQGRIFVVPPGSMAVFVAEEQQYWEEWWEAGSSRV